MFSMDCIKLNGTSLGVCGDQFYFGSCCLVNDSASDRLANANESAANEDNDSIPDFDIFDSLELNDEQARMF